MSLLLSYIYRKSENEVFSGLKRNVKVFITLNFVNFKVEDCLEMFFLYEIIRWPRQ